MPILYQLGLLTDTTQMAWFLQRYSGCVARERVYRERACRGRVYRERACRERVYRERVYRERAYRERAYSGAILSVVPASPCFLCPQRHSMIPSPSPSPALPSPTAMASRHLDRNQVSPCL